LREFSFGHARQLESVLREHLVAPAARAEVLAGLDEQAFMDIGSLLRAVYGHAKQGASYGHTKVAQAIVTARAAGAAGRSSCAVTPPTATARWSAHADAARPSSPTDRIQGNLWTRQARSGLTERLGGTVGTKP
jgi:hypothetical protein